MLHALHNRHCVALAWKHWRLRKWGNIEYSVIWALLCFVYWLKCRLNKCGREPLPMLTHVIKLCLWMNCFCSVLAMRWHCCHGLMSPLSEYAPEMMKSIRFDVPTGLERIRGNSSTTNKCIANELHPALSLLSIRCFYLCFSMHQKLILLLVDDNICLCSGATTLFIFLSFQIDGLRCMYRFLSSRV